MKWLITGLGGTLPPVLARTARQAGADVLGWDRSQVPPDDAHASRAWLERERPTAIAHLATGSAEWAGRLAAYGAERGIPFVFTSSAMVFDHDPDGPHAPHDDRTARDDYGQYKIACEDAVLSAYPEASVVRIGWQIDGEQAGNNMLMALDAWQRDQGRVAASTLWRPACSFMGDTADALVRLLLAPGTGVHHLDSNAGEGHTFYAVACALRDAFGREAWQVEPNEAYAHDQRLVGGLEVPPLSARLGALMG